MSHLHLFSGDAIRREMERTPGLRVTLPNLVDDAIIDSIRF